MKTLYCVICGKYRKFGKLKVSYISCFYYFTVNARIKIENYLKKKNQLRY